MYPRDSIYFQTDIARESANRSEEKATKYYLENLELIRINNQLMNENKKLKEIIANMELTISLNK